MADAASQAAVEAAITSRRSIRAFLPKPVPQADVAHLLGVAARAPSGSNIQPWKVYALAGAARVYTVVSGALGGLPLQVLVTAPPEGDEIGRAHV